MSNELDLLRKFIKSIIKEQKLNEVYDNNLAKKTAEASKFDSQDIYSLFTMIKNYYIKPDSSSGSGLGPFWTNLTNGLESEADRSLANSAAKKAKEIASLELSKKKLRNQSLSLPIGHEEEFDDKIDQISDSVYSLEHEIKSIAINLSKKHVSPKTVGQEFYQSRYQEPEQKKIAVAQKALDANMPGTVVLSKKKS